jgi:hypothetical protein
VTTIAAEQRVPCDSCEADIFFALTDRGKRMPLDPDPHPAGNVLVWEASVGPHGSLRCRTLGRAEVDAQSDDVELYRTHFATCPDAARFRSRR